MCRRAVGGVGLRGTTVTDNDSRGALLFETWAAKFAGAAFTQTANFKVPYTLSDPLNTPNGLKDPAAAVAMLEAAAKETIAKYGALDRPWGEVNRFHHRRCERAGQRRAWEYGELPHDQLDRGERRRASAAAW